MSLSVIPNLYDFYISSKRAGAINIIFEYNRKLFKTGCEFNYGDLHIGVFVKLIRQYFAKRTSDSTTVFFNNIPVSSPEDLQNINITFEFSKNNIDVDDFIAFNYIIRNSDTNSVIAHYICGDNRCYKYYHNDDVEKNDFNICKKSDYIFDDVDFDCEECYVINRE